VQEHNDEDLPAEMPMHPLRAWRSRHGVSQKELADLVGVTQSFVSLIEGYHNIPLGDGLEELRRITGLPTDAFIRPQQFLSEFPDFLGRGH
jgi:transcriptional regulator with XRE-family HTH domain